MDIKVLKANQVGVGILIEHDAGFISPLDEKNSKIIREFANPELSNRPDKLIVYAVLQKYGVKNRNGRIYTKEVLIRENERYQVAIQNRYAVGELDHPETTVVAGDRISHNIIETWWEGQTLMGKLEILMSDGYIKYGIVSTKGDEVANLLKNKITIGVSSRGIGSLKQVGSDLVVQDDFELICWDVVTAPSTPGSWIFNSRKEADPFVESVKKSVSPINESLDKFLLK